MLTPYYEALPSNLKPTHYDVSVYDIDTSSNTFNGTVCITANVNLSTDEISLNYRDLKTTAENISVKSVNTGNSYKAVSVEWYEKKDFFVIKLDEEIDASEVSEVQVSIKYEANIQTNMTGFYRSEYEEDGEQKVMLLTQFEAPDARRAFPCFDEPNLKATLSIQLTVQKEWTGLSNMPVESEEISGNLKTYKFEKTPKVSPYLVAWACGDFEYVESFTEDLYNGKPLPVRIYTTKGYSETAHVALDIAPRVVDYFSKVFEVQYPLPKLDLIAVHSFSHNAMKNWGLVTYRSNALLFDEKKSDISFKKHLCYVVCHELAHMWFGDLVTMQWWDELWLNEGFATYVGYLAVDYLFPEWDIFNLVTYESLQEALTLDGLRSSHPIHVPVIDAIDVDQIFDAISYKKGCSIITMLSTYIGSEVFLKGVAKYLQKNKFGNATTADLWASIEAVSGKPISSMMSNWVGKIGFPLVNVELDGSNLIITQSRFLSTGDVQDDDDTTVWWIPLNISSGPTTLDQKEVAIDSFESKRVILDNFPTSEFFKLNKDSAGFYRVCYSPEIIDKVIIPNMDKLSVRDKIGLFSDVSAVAIAGLGTSNTVTLMKLLKGVVDSDVLEEDYSLWLSLADIFKKLKVVFSGDESKYIAGFLKSIYSKIGSRMLKEVKEGGLETADFSRSTLISTIFNSCGSLRIPEFVDYAETCFKSWESDGKLHPSLTFFVFSTIANKPDLSEKEFDKIADQITNPSSLDSREHAVKALPSVSNPKYVERLFHMLMDTSIVPLMESHYMAAGLTLNSQIRDQFWTFFKENYDSFYGKLSVNVPVLERFIRFTFVNYQSEYMYKDLQDFYFGKDLTGFERSYGQAVDTIKTNYEWYKRDQEAVKTWLHENVDLNL